MIYINYKKLYDITENKWLPDEYVWYSLLDNLSNGDITKYDDILDMNYIHILNILSYNYYKYLYLKNKKYNV